MKTMFYSLLVALFCGVASTAAYAQGGKDSKVNAEKMALIERMVESVGLGDIIIAMFTESMQAEMGGEEEQGLPEGFNEVFIERITSYFNVQDFVEEAVAPVLNKYFSIEDLKLGADFLDSDLGKELIASKLNDQEFDFEEKLQSGDVDEVDAMKAMQLIVRFGPRKDELANIGKEIEVHARRYGERIGMEAAADVMQDYMDAELEYMEEEVE